MRRYIDREQALSHPFANGQYDKEHANEHYIFGFEDYKEWLEQLPTADVVEVVRCKDCKYAHKFADINVIPLLSCNYKNAHGMLVENHGYCKWGKRKE